MTSSTYRRATRALQPSRAEMDRRNAPLYAARAQAIVAVDAMVALGANLRDAYRQACERRDRPMTETEARTEAALRVELLHRIRRA